MLTSKMTNFWLLFLCSVLFASVYVNAFDQNPGCTPGQKYKMDCNTCLCMDTGVLMCTKMMCNQDNENAFGGVTNSGSLEQTPSPPGINQGCIPGQSYKIDCNTCHCSDGRVVMCTKMICQDEDDILPPPISSSIEHLPAVQQQTQKQTSKNKNLIDDFFNSLQKSTISNLMEPYYMELFDQSHFDLNIRINYLVFYFKLASNAIGLKIHDVRKWKVQKLESNEQELVQKFQALKNANKKMINLFSRPKSNKENLFSYFQKKYMNMRRVGN